LDVATAAAAAGCGCISVASVIVAVNDKHYHERHSVAVVTAELGSAMAMCDVNAESAM